ncbi:MAG: hypothetical protein ACR5LB_04200 [Wolbachia sp.]
MGLKKLGMNIAKTRNLLMIKKTDQYKKKFEEFYNLGTNYTNLLPKEEAGNYPTICKTGL